MALNAQHSFCASFSHPPNENNDSSLLCKLLRNIGLPLGEMQAEDSSARIDIHRLVLG